MKISGYINNKAFSLLEITVVIIIITILASGAIPVLSRAYIEKAGTKIALDISAIQDAARAYYINNNAWPGTVSGHTAMGDLTSGNYLPSTWNAINPFGSSSVNPSAYAYNISVNVSPTGSYFTVSTFVPTAAQSIIENLLPASGLLQNNNIYYVCSSIPVPGASSSLPTGMIMPWASNALPAGFLWCNGQTVSIGSYPGLYAVIGTTYGGDGMNTFALPDIMGRTIVGVDGMGGAGTVNRITQWSALPATLGGTFGEEAHRQSITEMAPHDHGETGYAYAGGSIHELRYSDSNQAGDSFSGNYTLSAGGNGDGTGLGAPANIVQPSIAMGYIIKY